MHLASSQLYSKDISCQWHGCIKDIGIANALDFVTHRIACLNCLLGFMLLLLALLVLIVIVLIVMLFILLRLPCCLFVLVVLVVLVMLGCTRQLIRPKRLRNGTCTAEQP